MRGPGQACVMLGQGDVMSAPVSNNDNKNADDPSFYAPPGARRAAQSLTQPASPSMAPPAALPASQASQNFGFTQVEAADPGSERPDIWSPLPAPPESLPLATERRDAQPLSESSAPAMQRAPKSNPPKPSVRPTGDDDGEHEFDRAPAHQDVFAGDIAVRALRHRLALSPEAVPEPPLLAEPRPRHAMASLVRAVAFVFGAAVVAFCVTALTLPQAPAPKITPSRMGEPNALNTAALGTLLKSARLVVEERQAAFENEPLHLGVSLTGAVGGEFALLTGLAPGTRFSAGSPIGAAGWKLTAREMAKAFAVAPRDFVGVMHAAVDLRASNNSPVDRQTMPLEWVPKQLEPVRQARFDRDEIKPRDEVKPMASSSTALNADEVANLVRRGQDYIKNGDLAAARLVLRRAAGAHNPQAALALGTTFDPLVFDELGVLGFQPDAGQARTWYERADKLGSREARQRLDRLAKYIR
jgi:hypothetical protein